jgi:signal peptidase II
MNSAVLIFGLVFVLDRISKNLIVKLLPYGYGVNIIGEYVRIVHIRNPNSLWGMSLGKNFPYIIVSIIAIVFLSALIRDALKSKERSYANIFSLIVSGVAGNLMDRIHFKGVVDFIDIGISADVRWPVFNVADSAISIGLVIYFIMVIRESFAKRSEK